MDSDCYETGKVRTFTINFRKSPSPPPIDEETALLIAAAQSTEDYCYEEVVETTEDTEQTENHDTYPEEFPEVSPVETTIESNGIDIQTKNCVLQEQGSTVKKKRKREKIVFENDSDLDNESYKQEDPGLGQAVAEHYNQKDCGSLEVRQKSRIFYMRNFNNWTKSMLIDEFLTKCKKTKSHGIPLKVLDMGCGKGGDMLKWINGGVHHVIFADIANVSIEHCKVRYDQLRTKEKNRKIPRRLFTAEYIAADCSKTRLRHQYEDKAMEIDLVSCQFCIHYSFESFHQAKCMLKNAAECLKVGGYFIGTVPDSNEIIARQRHSKEKGFGNEVYQIECLFDIENESIPLFGAKYDFNLEGVVNCPEFLVHFGLFEKLAENYGLRLVLKENFKTFFERKSKDNYGKMLLNKMSALETYPPNEGVEMVGKTNDYCHAESYLSEHSNYQKIGTLSKAEWEAITLYQVFAFEKVKDVSLMNLKRQLEQQDSSTESSSKQFKADET